MRLEDDPAVRALLVQQDGVIHRRQLTDLGVSRAAIRWQLARGWRAVLPDVLTSSATTLTSAQRRQAGQLWAGPEARLTGCAAAHDHGLRSAPDRLPLVFLTSPALADRRSGFAVVRRTERPDLGPWERDGVRLVGRPRAVVDAARELGVPREARAMFIEAVQRRLMTVEQLAHEVLDGPRRGRRMLLAALEDAASGVWSVPESDLLKGLARSLVLPEAWPNPVLTAPDGRSLVSPDCWFDEVALAVMVHSRTHHQREDDFEATIESDGDLQAHGATVIGVTPRSIARNMAAIVTRTEQTYLQLVRRGARPDIRAVPRQAGVRVAGPVADGVTGSRRS